MLGSLELLAAGACMGGSMTGFAMDQNREPTSAYIYNLIMMVIGTLAVSLSYLQGSIRFDPIYLAAASLIAASLGLAALRAFATGQSGIGAYLSALSAAVTLLIAQTVTSGLAGSLGARLIA